MPKIKIKRREGGVYRNYTCKGCGETGEFSGHKQYSRDNYYRRSETSPHYQCPKCFPKDYNGFVHPDILTQNLVTKRYYQAKIGDDIYVRAGKQALTPEERECEGEGLGDKVCLYGQF